jgi:hypothetical protein
MQKITSRDFFASLRYVDPENINRYVFGNKPVIAGYPVFTSAELANEPLKWLKYLLLARLGLRPLEELTQDIQRYPFSNWQVAQSRCIDFLVKAQQHQQSSLIVVKLVPMDKAGQLPNFHISQLEEVEKVFKAVCAARQPTDVEIWFCQSTVGIGTLSLAGRLTLPGYSSFGPSWLEVVWYTSPRLLENIDLSTFPYPYLRAVRHTGQLAYRVDKLHIPPTYLSSMDTDATQFLRDFQWLGTQIASYREKIATLEAILTYAGANELSLEFKSDAGHFRFIDWDTEVETAERIR